MAMNERRNQPRDVKGYVGLVLRGFAMGAADVVPGVSGGTMAFILGIYEELINSIRSVLSPQVIRLLVRVKIREMMEVLPWKFLLAVGVGIFLAIISLANFLEWMLQNKPALLWSFFFGLVLASILTVIKRVERWSGGVAVGVVAGAVAAYIIVGLVPAETPNTPLYLFLSGILAICAMVLPGISGAFILVLLGKYEYVLAAVTNRDALTLAIVAAGAAVGIVSFAQVLGWLLKRYHDVMVAVLTGLMIGSLRKIWPWKETVSFIVGRHGEAIPVKQVNVLPPAWSTEVTLALMLAVVGFAVVTLLSTWVSKKTESDVGGEGEAPAETSAVRSV